MPAAFVMHSALHLPSWAIFGLSIVIIALFSAASYSRQNNNWLGVECFNTERYARYADPALLKASRR